MCMYMYCLGLASSAMQNTLVFSGQGCIPESLTQVIAITTVMEALPTAAAAL